MTNEDEKILIKKYLQESDEKSLEFLIQAYLKPIYGFVFRYAGNPDDAEEITQETFVKVWRHLKKFDHNKSFKTWLFSIAKNTALDFVKRKKTIPFSAFDQEGEDGENLLAETLADPAPLPLEILEQEGIAQMLESATSRLSPKYQMILFLHYQGHFTFQEISEILDEPIDTIKSRHRRALIILRKLLDAPKHAS